MDTENLINSIKTYHKNITSIELDEIFKNNDIIDNDKTKNMLINDFKDFYNFVFDNLGKDFTGCDKNNIVHYYFKSKIYYYDPKIKKIICDTINEINNRISTSIVDDKGNFICPDIEKYRKV